MVDYSYIVCIGFVVYCILVVLFIYFCIKFEPSKPTRPIRLPYHVVTVKKPQIKISDSEENQLSKSRLSAAGLSYIANMENVTPPSSPGRIWTISSS